jgi:hypothetical protein
MYPRKLLGFRAQRNAKSARCERQLGTKADTRMTETYMDLRGETWFLCAEIADRKYRESLHTGNIKEARRLRDARFKAIQRASASPRGRLAKGSRRTGRTRAGANRGNDVQALQAELNRPAASSICRTLHSQASWLCRPGMVKLRLLGKTALSSLRTKSASTLGYAALYSEAVALAMRADSTPHPATLVCARAACTARSIILS